MTRKVDSSSSFLSFPLHVADADSTASASRRRRPRRPSPLDLYELPTLEALPTPAPSSTPSHDSQSVDIPVPAERRRPRRLRKQASGIEMRGGDWDMTMMMEVPKKRKDKDKEKAAKAQSIKQATSFLPMDEDVKSKPKSKPSRPTLPVPPRPAPRQRPQPLDPSIFGHTLRVVRAEDLIEQVLRLQKEDEKRQRERSFTPALHPARPLSRQRGQTIAHQPSTSISASRSTGGSMRQHHHAPMPSIQGVIEGGGQDTDHSVMDRRDTLRLPITCPPATGGDHLQRLDSRRPSSIRSTRSDSPPVSAPSSPIREHLYPGSGDAVVVGPPRGRPPTYFSNRSPITPMHPESHPVPPVPAAPSSPRITRHRSLTPSTTSQTDHAWRSSRHVEPDDERLTAVEILEELNGGLEEGWEFGVLAKERSQAGLDKQSRHSKRLGMAAVPSISSTGTSFTIPMDQQSAPEREGSIKDVRSWRETRKKTWDRRPASEQQHQHRPRSLKPQRSAEGLEPLYEVSYTVNSDPDPVRDERPPPVPMSSPPPVPPRAPGRASSQLKLEVLKLESGRTVVDVPVVLDSPVKETRTEKHAMKMEDQSYSVPISPATSPTPIHLRPLPPLPNMSPHHMHKSQKSINPLASFKHADGIGRLLRPKRASVSPRPPVTQMPHHSTPPAFTEPLSPLDSPPPASPRRRLSARDEPHAALPHRQVESSFVIDRAQSRKQGMTALSFLALEDPSLSYSKASTDATSNRNSLDMALAGRRRESVQAHILPPAELVKLYGRRRSSTASESGMSRDSMMVKEEVLQEEEERDRQDARMSFGLSPPPRHHRRSFEPPPRLNEDEDDLVPLSLSPPPRLRNSLSGRRPSTAPSPVYIDTTGQPSFDSYLDISPSPSPLNFTPVTPEQTRPPRRLGSASSAQASPRDMYRNEAIGHAAELRGMHEDSQAKDMERQALNEWLAQPRARKASVPVNGISRIRQGVFV